MVVPTTARDGTVSLPDPVPGNVDIDPFWMPFYSTDPIRVVAQSYLMRQREQVLDRLRRAMSHRQWDLILAGRESFLPGLPALARELGVPSVGFMRGAMKAGLSGAHPDKAFTATIKEACRQTGLIIPVARHLERDFLAAGYGNVATVPNGVDIDLFKPSTERRDLRARLGLDKNAKVVVHASNFKALKRVDHIVEAARRLMAVDDEIVFLLIGDGPEHADIQERCTQFGLAKRFVFPGWVGNNDVADYYNLSDVAVLASETEVMPRFILETMACGRPVVANDIPASLELIDQGSDGFIYPSGDIDTLCERVLTLLRDTDRRRLMGRAAREKIVSHYDVRMVTELFEDTVNRFLTGYRAPMPAGGRHDLEFETAD
jgi:glycosyltransferase involved in cell wall biosynthesis